MSMLKVCEDILTVVGVPTLEAACLFTAAVSVGIGYAVSLLFFKLYFD